MAHGKYVDGCTKRGYLSARSRRTAANTCKSLGVFRFRGSIGVKGGSMNKSAAVPCSKAVSLFRGLYARVGRDLGVDVSYISRIARGERKSKVAERAINREFNRVLQLIRTSSPRSGNNLGKKSRI
jgi:hypothetical protein